MFFVLPSKRYNYAMLKAIDKARSNPLFHDGTKTDGLRVIRSFERVNKIAFNPFNNLHILMISGMSHNERLIRNLKIRARK